MSTTTPAGGRRMAPRRRPTLQPTALTALVLAVLAAAAVGLTRAPGTDAVDARGTAGLVDRTLLGCPGAPADARGEVRAGLAAVPGDRKSVG